MSSVTAETLERASRALDAGELVVYPTETVYGLGADALDPAAIERVFQAKGRQQSKPISLAVPTVQAAEEVVVLNDRERAFCREFLPGPVTVVCQRRPCVPDALTGGRDRVGVRVPDHPVASALLERYAPLTATSANLSGDPAPRTVKSLAEPIRAAATVVIDGGETPGGGSTVVDVATGEIHREGAAIEAVRSWVAKK